MRKKIIAGNWKMNSDIDFGIDFLHEITKNQPPSGVEVILGVPYISIHALSKISDFVSISAQNCYQKTSGAFTGEISAKMLKSSGASYVILGHSERRQYFNESDDLILEKMNISLEEGLKVIYCCGEPLNEREANTQESFVQNQLSHSILKLSEDQMRNVVIAYEPIWAIGTGKTASSSQAQDMHAFIRNLIKDEFGETIAENISILYGGSVKPANAEELFAQPDVDGGLVGGASLKTDSFHEIIQTMKPV